MKGGKQKRLLLFGNNYSPEATGIGKYNTELCEWLNENTDLSVDVVTAFPYYPNWKLYKGYGNLFYNSSNVNGVNLLRCPIYIPAKPSGSRRMVQDFTFLFSTFIAFLYLLLFRKKYDYILTVSPPFILGLNGLFYRLFSPKTKLIVHIQDLQIDAAEGMQMIRSKTLLKVLYGIEKKILRNANVVSTISDGMMKKVAAKGIDKVAFFPNWVDTKTVYPLTVEQPPNIGTAIPAHKKLFFYSGAIGEKQGLDMLIDVAATMEKEFPDFLFLISGEGPYKQLLIKKAESLNIKNVLFSGLQPINVFNELLNYAHIHLILQKSDATDLVLPSKLTNILAVGGICLVTANKGTTLYDVIDKHKMGILVEPDNQVKLIEALIAYSNADLQFMRNNAIAYSKNNLLQEEIIKQFYQSNLS